MIFHDAPDDAPFGMVCRRVSEHGLIHIGVGTVLFGYRVRAGFVGDQFGYELEWCAGTNHNDLELLFGLCEAILSHREENHHAFDGIPSMSDTKPALQDDAFVQRVSHMAAAPANDGHGVEWPMSDSPHDLPPLSEIRHRSEDHWSTLDTLKVASLRGEDLPNREVRHTTYETLRNAIIREAPHRVPLIMARDRFAKAYCASRQWDIEHLTMQQILAIHADPAWPTNATVDELGIALDVR